MSFTSRRQEAAGIGVIILIPPAYINGYYWAENADIPMGKAAFCANPKDLRSDFIWFTNLPFDKSRGVGAHIKHNAFFRVPIDRLAEEVAGPLATDAQKAMALGRHLRYLLTCPERTHLRDGGTLAQTFNIAQFQPNLLRAEIHEDWDSIGRKTFSSFWTGSSKPSGMLSGAFWLPRFDMSRQIVRCDWPDLSSPPHILNGPFPTDEKLLDLLADTVGFVEMSIEKPSRFIQDFMSFDRTFYTTVEAAWLFQHARISVKRIYACKRGVFPLRSKEFLAQFNAYSWLDSLRMEAAIFAYTLFTESVAHRAWLRGLGHIYTALHAELMVRQYGCYTNGLSYGKINIACMPSEVEMLRRHAQSNGLLLQIDQDVD